MEQRNQPGANHWREPPIPNAGDRSFRHHQRQGVLKVRRAPGTDTTVQRIVNLVLDAREEKARQEKFIDRLRLFIRPLLSPWLC